jgi:type I restriction enzyme S subunit
MRTNTHGKESELGRFPEDWEVLPFSRLVTEFRGGAPLKPSDFTKHGVKVLPKGGVGKAGWLDIGESDLQYCSESYAASHRSNVVDESYTIVVLRDLVPSGPTIGSMVRIRDREKYVLAQGVYGFKVNNRVAPEFLVQLSQTRAYRSVMNTIMVGSTQVHISNTAFKRINFALPPLAEQRAIAEALGDVDALLASLDRLIVKKRDIKQAVMQQLLTGKTRLPGFSGDWEIKRLGEIATFLKGKGLPKSEVNQFGPSPCIHYGELFTHYRETISNPTSRTDRSAAAVLSCANDVLMPTSDVTPRGLAKASCITMSDVVLGGDILIIRTDPACINGSFLSSVIRHQENQVLSLVTGSTVYHLYAADMKKFEFGVPSFSEQTAVVAVLSDMTADIDALEARRDKTRLLKQGMMQELLTGRTRLV